MKLSSVLSVLLAVVALVLIAAPLAQADPAAPAPAAETKAATAKADDDGPSAAERRAAGSEFEREKLDQGAFEEAERGAGASGEESEGGGSGSVFRAIFGLVVVLGAIFGIHWLLKKWGQSRLQGVAGSAGVIDVVATTALAQGRALHLVRIGDELVLVGATEQSITRLGEVDATALGTQRPAGSANGSSSAEFQAMLSGAMYGTQPGVPSGMGGAGAANEPFLKRFLDNLRMTTAR